MASNVDTRNLENKGFQRLPALDKSTWARSGVDYAHHEVHQGKHFFIAQGYTFNGVYTIWFQTGNDGSLCHLIPTIVANNPYAFIVVEAPTDVLTISDVPYNNRRPSANVSAARWRATNTAPTGGTVLANLLVGSAGQGNQLSLGGETSAREELILKAKTLYAFSVTVATSSNVNWILEWYEHTDKE